MVDSTSLQDSLDAVYRFLSYRPRSEGEIRQWCRRRGLSDEAAEQVLFKLREQKLSDDLAFARFWKENRLAFRPKSRRLIQKELRDKRVAPEIIAEVTEDIDDDQIAYRLARNRMPSLVGLEYPQFHRRLSSYLTYRGFGYEVVRRTAALLWQERNSG